jgi:hypothetical protein
VETRYSATYEVRALAWFFFGLIDAGAYLAPNGLGRQRVVARHHDDLGVWHTPLCTDEENSFEIGNLL